MVQSPFRPCRSTNKRHDYTLEQSSNIKNIHYLQTFPDVAHAFKCCCSYLPHIHGVTKDLHRSFQHDLSGQLAAEVEDDVTLSVGLHGFMCHSQFVVARQSGVVGMCGDISVLEDFHNPLGKPKGEKTCNEP